jgi:uncharacterized membrane protein
MRLKPSRFIALAILLLGALAAVIFAAIYFFTPVTLPDSMRSGFGAGTSRARIVEIINKGSITLGDVTQPYKVLRVELLDGDYKGILMDVDYGNHQVLPEGSSVTEGDEILVSIGKSPDGVLTAYYADVVRRKPLLILLLVFVASIILISGWKGVRSLIALVFSMAVIIGYIIPHILSGEDPVRVSIIGAVVLLGVTLYLTYGWTLKTHASVAAMVLALIITGILTWLFAALTHLTGIGSEDAMFLMQLPGLNINIRGLMLGGMIIGALGVLDDLVTSQSSAVFELHQADPEMGFRDLFRRGMRIGQDHVAATVNTLVLAYVGSSLAMLLLFTLARSDWSRIINFEIIAVEVVRALVGSLGLIYAVPIATGIAGWLALNHGRLGEVNRLLGPEGAGHSH